MMLLQSQENDAILDEKELQFLASEQVNTYDANVDNQPVRDMTLNDHNIFQADECDAFDSDVDDEPMTQSIFMANLSSAVSSIHQASSLNPSILSELPILDDANDNHEILNEVQQTNFVVLDNDIMEKSHIIPYDQYLKHNEEYVVPSCASYDEINDYVLHKTSTYASDDSLTTEIKTDKDQVAIYEQRAKFEWTNREQIVDLQMCILVQERNA